MSIEFNKQQDYLKIQNDLVDYLNGNNDYPLNYEYLRFIILDNKNDIDDFYAIFEDELKNPIHINIKSNNKDKLLIIYHNKERILFEEYIDSISEDLGKKIKLFEGFKLDTKDSSDLVYIINLILEYHKTEYSYSSISELVHKLVRVNPSLLQRVKDILFKDFLTDSQFGVIVEGMFKNNLNVSKTSSYIYMHRNTLNNKLALIEDVTTLSLHTFKDAIAIYELLK